MEFLLLIHGSDEAWAAKSPEERKQTYAAYGAYEAALAEAGVKVLGGAELRAASTATVVRGVGPDALVTDGPFTETREQFGGYYSIDVATQAEAVEWAKRMPAQIVEVRGTVQP
jgi:hypothetical protein